MFSALKKLVGSDQAAVRDKNIPAGLQSMNQALQRRFAKGVQYNSELAGALGRGLGQPRGDAGSPARCPVRCPETAEGLGVRVLALCGWVLLGVFAQRQVWS